jgi:CTP:molybdopterin cytidylyltransferase MocA
LIFNELRNLPLDRSAKQLIANCEDHVGTMSKPEAGRDIDTPEHYRELSEASNAKPKEL